VVKIKDKNLREKIIELSKIDFEDIKQGRKSGLEENVKNKITRRLLECLNWNEQKDFDYEFPVRNRSADIALKISGKPHVIIETKSLEQELDKHKLQALSYAQEKGVLWVILTNGNEIRLYKSFIQGVDNEKNKPIFQSLLIDLPKNFVELKKYIGKENIKNIEKIASYKIREIKELVTAEKLEETLKLSKELIYEDFIKKFIEYYENNQNFKEKIDSWLLEQNIDKNKEKDWFEKLCKEASYTIINRILFRRICEDRNFAPKKLTADNLKAWKKIVSNNAMKKLLIEVFGDQFGTKFTRFYNAPIFDHINFSEIDINENIIENFLLELSKYNFKEINRDILGNVYQKHIDKEERKKLGQFYTPDWIINYILNNIPLKTDYKIIDPCCGSGGFLLKAYDILAEKLRTQGLSEYKIHEKILKENLFGIDINPFAAQLTVMNLLLKNIDNPVNIINVVDGDSLSTSLHLWTKKKHLLEKIKETSSGPIFLNQIISQKFDIVVGNPPYFNLKKKDIDSKYRNVTSKGISSGVLNIASLFIKKYIDSLVPEGYLGFIIPKSLTWVDSWEPIRKYILGTCEIKKIVDVGKAFSEVGFEQVIIILRRNNDNKKRDSNIVSVITEIENLSNNKYQENRINQALFNELGIFALYFNETLKPIFDKINENSIPLVSLSNNVEIFRGLPIQKEKALISDNRKNLNYVKLIRGKDIDSYITESNLFLLLDKQKLKNYLNLFRRLEREKIIAQRLVTSKVRIVATYDSEKTYNLDTITNIIINTNKFDPKYILAILNSEIAAFFIRDFVFNRSTLTMDLDRTYLGKIPIKKISANNEKLVNEIIGLVNKILKLGQGKSKKDAGMLKIENEINKKIFELYGLNKNQVKVIKELLK